FKTITVSAWVRHDSLTQPIQRYVTVGPETAVLRCASGAIHFYIRTNGELRHVFVSNLLEAGKWSLITGTWDGAAQRVYKDGTLAGSQSPGGTLNGAAPHVVISSSGEPMRGLIDDVRIYNRAL